MRRAPESDIINDSLFKLMLATVWVLISGWAVACHLLGAHLAGGILAFGSLVVSPLVLWLYRRGSKRLASHLFIISGVSYIVDGCEFICGEAGFEYYFLAGTVIVALLFRPERLVDLTCAVGAVFLGWVLTQVVPTAADAWYLPPHVAVNVMRDVNFALAYGMNFVLTYGYLRLSLGQSRDLQDLVATSRAAEDLLVRTFANMREGVMLEDGSGRVIRRNDQCADFLGLPAAYRAFDVRGRLLAPGEMPSRLAALTKTAQVDVTLRVVRADGVARWLNVTAVPVTVGPGEGARTHVLTTMLDVTKRKASEDLLLQIVNSTPDWIFIKDRDHRYVVVNDSYAAALKRAPESIVGRTDLELGFPDAIVRGDAARGIRGFWTDDDLVLATRAVHTFENDPVVIDGAMHTFHTIKAPLFAVEGEEPYGVLGFARDITDMKEVERKLVDSSKMASLGEMAGGIAHEINNPLAVIDGRSRLLLHQLQGGTLNPAQATEAVGRIVATVERIGKIVKGLKTFARGGENDPLEPVTLRAVIEDSVALAAERFRTHATPLEVAGFEDLTLLGSAAQLAQVLINLLNNAHDAVADQPGRWVRVSVSSTPKLARLTVTDSGLGIPPEIAERLSQPFFTTKPVGQGTGLGLMISRRIVERHGGRLFLDHQAVNTTFVIELPRPATTPSTVGRSA